MALALSWFFLPLSKEEESESRRAGFGNGKERSKLTQRYVMMQLVRYLLFLHSVFWHCTVTASHVRESSAEPWWWHELLFVNTSTGWTTYATRRGILCKYRNTESWPSFQAVYTEYGLCRSETFVTMYYLLRTGTSSARTSLRSFLC